MYNDINLLKILMNFATSERIHINLYKEWNI